MEAPLRQISYEDERHTFLFHQGKYKTPSFIDLGAFFFIGHLQDEAHSCLLRPFVCRCFGRHSYLYQRLLWTPGPMFQILCRKLW